MAKFFELIESLTFSVPQREIKVHDVSDLSNQIDIQIEKSFNIAQTVMMDGFDVGAKKGIINFYVFPKIPKDKIDKIVKAIIYYVKEFGWSIDKTELNNSQMFNVPTYRFHVHTNDKEIKMELNITNQNALKLLHILNYSNQEIDEIFNTGKINIRDLKIKLNNYVNFDQHVEKSKQDKNHYNQGVSKEQLMRYYEILEKLCDIALQNDEDFLEVY